MAKMIHFISGLSLFLCATAVARIGQLKVLRTLPHSGYSEGLDWHQGKLWHALPKAIVQIDPADGSVLKSFLPATEYSESLQWFKGKLWNLSFSDNGIYAASQVPAKGGKIAFEKLGNTKEDHGWGLAQDGTHLIMTGNFSNVLYFVNPSTAKIVRELPIRVAEKLKSKVNEVKDLEDLAWDGKHLWSSSFSQDPLRGTLLRIDVKKGEVDGIFALPEPGECPVIDGIAFDGRALWITGKECPKLYQVALPER